MFSRDPSRPGYDHYGNDIPGHFQGSQEGNMGKLKEEGMVLDKVNDSIRALGESYIDQNYHRTTWQKLYQGVDESCSSVSGEVGTVEEALYFGEFTPSVKLTQAEAEAFGDKYALQEPL